jgi:hypothetical protein
METWISNLERVASRSDLKLDAKQLDDLPSFPKKLRENIVALLTYHGVKSKQFKDGRRVWILPAENLQLKRLVAAAIATYKE